MSKSKNAIKGAAVAVVLAGGMGAARVAEHTQGLLQRISTAIRSRMAGLAAVADASHEEYLDEEPTITGRKL